MTIARWLAVIALGVVALLLMRGQERVDSALPIRSKVRVFFVRQWTLAEAQNKGGAFAVMPSRAGRVGESWGLEETLRTGSRSPVLSDTPRWSTPIESVEALKDISLPKEDESIVIIGLPRQQERAELIPLLIGQAGQLPALLTSPSTRRTPGLVAATDLATTLMSLSGKPQQIGAGQELRLVSADSASVSTQVEVWESQHRALKFLKFVPWGLAGLLLLAAWRRWIWLKHFAIAYPLGLLVVPAGGVREAWIYLGAALIAGGLAALGERGIKGATWVTVWIVLIDVALGGWVSARTPLSYSPIEAARFYGIGNEIEGYLIGAALIAGAGDIVVTALLGVVVSVVLGAPMLGADFGGFLTSIVTFFVATLVQVKKKWRVWAAVALVVLALLGTFALVRSSAGNHVGRAAAGGGARRMTVIARKLSMNAHLTLTSPWALLALVQVVLLWRQKKNPALLAGAGTVWLVNDSGVMAAALLLLWHEKAPGAARAPGAFETT